MDKTPNIVNFMRFDNIKKIYSFQST